MTLLERYNKAFENIDTQKIKYENYVIAYIDLLGVKEILRHDDGTALNMMKYLYSRLLCYIDPTNNGFFGLKDVKVKIFSDNIIIAAEINDNFEEAFRKVFNLTKLFQMEALLEIGWMLRGGISIGKLYINDVFTMGNSIIEAYAIESEIANYPRVLIDKKIIESINLSTFKMPYGIEEVYTDFDGENYINYLSCLNKESIKNKCEGLYKFYKEKSEQEQSLKVKQKYNWFINYIETILKWCENLKSH